MGSVPTDQTKGGSNSVAANAASPYAAFASATPNDVADQSWYFVSGSTHHITNNPSNLNQATNYFGKSQLIVANGHSIPIQSTGSAKLHKLDKTQPLLLKNILHSPSISKNLISISQLTSRNNIIIEFDSTFFSMEYKKTKMVLL